MPDPNLIYDPPEGFENASVFVTNPATQTETRTLLQRLFTQIQTFINTTLIAWINNTFATKDNITTNRKLSETGDFTGTLNGAEITSSDAGLAATVTGHLADSAYQLATGTGTAITLAISTLTDGYAKTFVVSANNVGVATTINGKPLYKPNTVIAPNLTTGKAVTVWYNLAGNCFFIKASAEGDAVAGDVLASKKFSNDNDTGLTGTLALTGDMIAADLLSGKTGYSNDPLTKITGTFTIPHNSQSYTTPGTYTFTVPNNVTQVMFIAGGAGGGGGSHVDNTAFGGGGGGGGAHVSNISVTPANTLSVVVGAGGTSVSGAGGGAGGNSSVSTYIGAGGAGGAAASSGGAGGSGGGYGSAGVSGGAGSASTAGAGGTSAGGAGGAGSMQSTTLHTGGNGKVIIIW